MKTKFCILVCLFIIQFAAKAQMKIGDNPTSINGASLLELETTDKGFVLPRVPLSDVNSSSPLSAVLLTGTVVYNTSSGTTGGSGVGIYLWNGSKWLFLSTGSSVSGTAWLLTGNSGLNASTNFIGTTDAIDFVARTANTERMRILGANSGSSKEGWIGMGITIPRSSLDVTGHYSNKNVLTLQNSSTSGYSSVDMLDSLGNLKGTFGYANLGTGGLFAGKDYFNIYGNDFLFTAGSANNDFFMKGSNGFVGINTNAPSERLHIVGNLYLTGAFMPAGNAGTSGYLLTSAGAGTAPVWSNMNGLAWTLTGNSGTNSAINFLGTTDNHPLKFQVNNTLGGFIDSSGGEGNVFLGYTAGLSNTTGLHNTAMGHQALSSNTASNNNTAFGYQALLNNTGTGNTAGGYSAMLSNTTGQYNTAYGLSALRNNTTGSYNVAVGQSALQNNTIGTNNAVVGEDGMLNNTTGRYLAGLGTNALYSNTTGNSNTAVGESTLYYNTTGNYNTSLGAYSLFNNTTAGNNISIGYYAGNLTTTGSNNIFIGSQSGSSNTTGTNNTLLGTNTGLLSTGLSNAGAIGYNAKVALNNSLVLGDTASGNYAINVGIGVRNPLKRLHIDAAPVSSASGKDSLKIDNLASSFSPYRKAILVMDSVTGYVSRQSINTLASGNFWSLTGNSGTNYATNFLGTTDNVSLRFKTNNTEQMIIDSLGRVGIGTSASAFDPLNPPKFAVDYGTTTSNTMAYFKGSSGSYYQVNLQNKSNSSNASTDYVATSDDGTDSTYYVDLGINSSTYAPGVENWGNQHDAYLYASSRNLLIGCQSVGSDVIFLLNGGQIRNNTVLRLKDNGNIVVGTGENTTVAAGNTLRGPNAQASASNATGGSLTVSGGNSTGTATGSALNLSGGATSGSGTGGSVNISGGGTSAGSYGAVNINANTASATYINTGTSTQNVSVGGGANNILFPKFSTVGGLYYTSVNTGQLSTTGSNMTWDSINNRLGIGLTSPGYKLSVLASSDPLYLSGVQATSTFRDDSVLTIRAGVVKKTPYSSLPVPASAWLLTGNSIIAGQFLGTTNSQALVFKYNSINAGYLDASNTSFGTSTTATGGSNNTAIGYSATAANSATAVGASANAANVANTAIGNNALANNSDHETAIGASSQATNQYNTAVGYNAQAITNAYATAVGTNSLATGYQSVALGTGTTANKDQTVAIGYNAQATGQYGIAIGNAAQAATNTQTIAIGVSSLANAQYNTAMGYSAQAISNTQATAIGSSATANAIQSTALGYRAQAISNGQTTAIGTSAQANAQYSTALGYNAQAITNSQTTALGSASQANAQYNTAVGYNAQSITNSYGTAVGTNTITSGQYATAVGAESDATTQYSTALGYNAQATSNNQATAIGASTSATGSNSTAVGYGATTSQNNALILGNTSANVGIGTSTPNTSTKLDVAGSFKLGSGGSVVKNVATGSAAINSAIASGAFTDLTITLSSTLSGATGTANASPNFDLPAGIIIAFTRIISTTTVRVRFYNASFLSQTVAGTIYATATEF